MIKEIVSSIFPLSDSCLNRLESLLTIENFNKGDIFIQRGKSNTKEYFLLKGICKSYLHNTDGQEITISFFNEKSVLSPQTIRTQNESSLYNFKALTNVQLASVDATLFQTLMIEIPEIRNFGNAVVRLELAQKVSKEVGLVTLSAKDRLLAFRELFHGFENIVPHSDIATYLGITNISLSRLRKEMLKSK